MAYLSMDKEKLKHNFEHLNQIFSQNDIQWAIVSKVLCGNHDFLKQLIEIGTNQICDSRLTNLEMIKQINPKVETIYIKPPSLLDIEDIVKYADITINTELETIEALSIEAKRQKVKHKVIIMIEMGELREGVVREEFIDFYKHVFELDSIDVVGIGANFSCLYGVLPNPDKLIQLCLYEQLIEAKFDRQIPFVSGGSSVVIPLIFNKTLPKGINHFRVGETLFFGQDIYNNRAMKNMHKDIFTLHAEIIELAEKPMVPDGEMGTNVEGKSFTFENDDLGKKSYRAILNLGLLDVNEKHIWSNDEKIEFVGASSDMTVIDIGDNDNEYNVGDLLEFNMDYMGLLRLMNSKYIDKRVI
ncbi:MAG: alanine racemase [Candidatus Zophobacter franzmannii]|jgi:predicted amino acid racemase|nr:alanine racemase [Candidatus Zophobacter franzmannii]